MAEKKKPAIRFRGFTEEWEERKLSDIAIMKARIGWQGLTQKEFLDEGDYYLITGTDFENGQINFTNCHFISKDRYEQDTNIQVKNGDVLITKDGTIGKVAYIRGLEKPATLNTGVFVIKGNGKNISNLYLYHYLAAPFLLDYANKQATGGTIKHLNQNVLVSFPISLPKVKEQQKIGEFYQSIDSLIIIYQRKYEKLQNIKKSMLEKMFPQNGSSVPEIRFKGFMEDWEQCKLNELVDRVIRKNINNESTLPLTISAQCGLVDQIIYFNNRVASRDVSNYYLILNGEFAYNKSTSDGYPFGAVKRLDMYEKGVLSTLYIVFSVKNLEKTNSDFMTIFFDTNRWHKGVSERAAEGARNHGLLNISVEDFFDIDLFIPQSEKEQAQIGAYFKELDHLITLHKHKLEKLQNIKKACLEKMFI